MSASAIPPTAANRGLAAAVNGRIRSDAVMLTAKASVWRLGAIGLLLMLGGIGVGATLYGWAYVIDSRTSYQQMASAFATALDHANLGRVKLDIPETVLKLDPNAAVHVDPAALVHVDPAALVHLDPQAKVTVGGSDIMRPTERQLQASGRVVTDFTIFKTVPLDGNHAVQTGWDFNSSEQTAPYHQFCHFRHRADDGSFVNITIAQDGRPVANTLKRAFGLDAEATAKNCVWFNGTPTQAGS